MRDSQDRLLSGGTSNPQNNKGQITRTYSITIDNSYAAQVLFVRVDR